VGQAVIRGLGRWWKTGFDQPDLFRSRNRHHRRGDRDRRGICVAG